MKILIISSSFPKDLHKNVHGIYKRMNMFIDGMKNIASLDMLFYVSHDVDVSPSSVSQYEEAFRKYWDTNIRLFLCSLPGSEQTKKKGKLSKLWYYIAGAFSFFRQTQFMRFSSPEQIKAFETCLLGNPDAIFVHRLHSMCPLLLTRKPLPPVYFDLDDIEHIAFKRSIRNLPLWYEKVLKYAQLPMLLLGQLKAIRLAKNTFICSELDRRYLKDRWHLPGITTIPNSVSIPEQQELTTEPCIMFIGSYNYRPNVEAADFLIEKIWPHVHRAMPSARLIIAGSYPERIRGYNNSTPGVTFPGFVDDLDQLYRQVRIVCTPIFTGGGTRVKIIEAAAYGKPVISTTLGAEGLEMNDGTELLLRDDIESYSLACLQLLENHSLCEKLGSAARKKAVQLYDRNNIIKTVQKQMDVSGYHEENQLINHQS